MSLRVGIVDYGAGNLHSVANALRKLGADPVVVANPGELLGFDRLLLPGVGAFAGAMACLKASGMDMALGQYASGGKPLLGICLGMQLMCKDSMEEGRHEGLGWIDASVIPFSREQGRKIPHMGWNAIRAAKRTALLEGVDDGSDVYFVHSYHVRCHVPEDALLLCDYGSDFVAGFSRDNLSGLQFHPEKSQSTGLRILANFLRV